MVAQENLKFEDIRPVPNSPQYFEGFKNLRGQIIPIINFKKLFSFSKFDMEKQKYIIIIEIEGTKFGVVVDKVLRVVYYENKDIKEVKTKDSEIDNYIFGVLEKDNELISVLDMKAIFNYTDKTLLIGNKDDEYILKHKRDKNINNIIFNKDSDRLIQRTMQKINFPINQTTEIGIKRLIAKISALREFNLANALNYIETRMKDPYYNNFNYKGNKIFFDIDSDYLAIQKIITNIIVPKKLEEKDTSIRIWNIGCDSGAEAYSVAFLIKNYVEDYFKWKVEITCSGKDYNLLNRAKNGIFSKDYFSRFYVRNFEEFLVIDEEKEVKDLDSLGNEIKIIQEIKDMIIFDMRDVLSSLSPPIKGCDMIIARNFLTDLSLEDTQKVLEIFSASLKSGGLLFLSEVESIESYSKDFVLSEIINRPYFVRV